MVRLNKWQREVLRLESDHLQALEKELWKVYNELLKNVRRQVREYIDEFEQLPEYQKAELNQLVSLERQIAEIVRSNYAELEELIIREDVKAMLEGYYSQFYTAEQTTRLPTARAILHKQFIADTINAPVDGVRLSQRLYFNREKLATVVNATLRQGVVSGKGYGTIAQQIKSASEADLYQALRIARTEGGRVRSIGRQKAQEELVDQGFKVKKLWISSLDERVRSQHRILDGQEVGIDEQFTIDGYRASQPRLFGVASLDINCRCSVMTIIDGVRPEFRRAGDGKVIRYTNYKDWSKGKVQTVDISELMNAS